MKILARTRVRRRWYIHKCESCGYTFEAETTDEIVQCPSCGNYDC